MNYATPTEWKSEAWWRNRPVDERLHHMHLPKRIRENLDGWHHCAHGKEPPNLFIQGPSGCGKSLVAASLLKHLVSEHNCSGRWIEADDYIEMLKDSFDTPDGNLPEMYSSPHIVKYVKAVFDIVVIDGLGEERLSPKYGEDLGFAQHELGSLIRKRYDKGKATIITSRLSIQDIKNRYGSRLASPLADFDVEPMNGKR